MNMPSYAFYLMWLYITVCQFTYTNNVTWRNHMLLVLQHLVWDQKVEGGFLLPEQHIWWSLVYWQSLVCVHLVVCSTAKACCQTANLIEWIYAKWSNDIMIVSIAWHWNKNGVYAWFNSSFCSYFCWYFLFYFIFFQLPMILVFVFQNEC